MPNSLFDCVMHRNHCQFILYVCVCGTMCQSTFTRFQSSKYYRINLWINAFGISYSNWNLQPSIQFTPLYKWWLQISIRIIIHLPSWLISINIENYYHAISSLASKSCPTEHSKWSIRAIAPTRIWFLKCQHLCVSTYMPVDWPNHGGFGGILF